MNLSRYDAKQCEWDAVEYPYPHTLAEVLFPNTTFAVIHALPGQDGVSAAGLVGRVPDGYQLDFATGARKKGDYIISDGDVASTFWGSPEEKLAYGSMLLTSCWAATPQSFELTILVVEDGEYGTGDCHGKASAGLYALLDGDDRHAAQFRMACKDEGVIAKGTLVVGDDDGYALAEDGIDAVLPASCFKSSTKPTTGLYTWDCVLGVMTWSEMRPTKSSWQILQWFTWDAVEKDLLPNVKDSIMQLREAMVDVRSLVKLLRLDAKEFELPLLDVILADTAGKLNLHPYIAWKASEMLRKRYQDLALGGGIRFKGLMALPDDTLPLGTFRTSDLLRGKYISTRYPLRYWGDLRVWENVGGARERGVVYMSHETAAILGGDFDGDYFQFVSVEEYPTLTSEIQGFDYSLEIVKVKDRKASPNTQLDLAREMLANAENKVGRIALLIARATACGRTKLVPKLAQELQVAVDKFKYNLDHDDDYLEACGMALPSVWWVKDRKNQKAYRLRTMKARGWEGTVGRLVQSVNVLWRPPEAVSMDLDSFTKLFQPDKELLSQARTLNARYGRLVSEALSIEDDDERAKAQKRVYGWLAEFAGMVEDREAWLATVWHVTHVNKTAETSPSKASLAFHLFPSEIAAWLSIYEQKQVITVVGLKYNDYKDNLSQFDGTVVPVEFVVDELSGKLRIAARVDDKRLGFVSYETPIQPSNGSWALTKRGQAVYATPALS